VNFLIDPVLRGNSSPLPPVCSVLTECEMIFVGTCDSLISCNRIFIETLN
jgi:hypothetical protein